MHKLVKIMKALSDETRLRTLNLLLERECCVCEVIQALGISQSTASRGLGALYDAGFLKQRRERLWVFYSIDRDKPQDFYFQLIDVLGKALKDDRVLQADRDRLRQLQPIISRR